MNNSRFSTTRGRRLGILLLSLGLIISAACVTETRSPAGIPGQVASLSAPAPIDPQVVRDQDDMTWADFRPLPDIDWNDPERASTTKQFKIAILVADFEDQPFVVTLPKGSDLFGNPRMDPISRDQVPRFYADFWNKPQAVNHGQTIHGYWMEQSRGRFGVKVDSFGPFRMPKKMFQYGLGGWGQEKSAPEGYKVDGRLDKDVDTLWKEAAGADIQKGYDIVLRIFAGYDETAVWQEFGEMKFQTKDNIPAEWGNPDPSKPRWAPTRYIPWTSWKAASMLWANSAIIMGECSGAIRHEIAHFAFRVGDNNNNPYVQPYRRAGSGPWDLMDRGSFNGPGGPHRRWIVPVIEGGSMPAALMIRQKMNFKFLETKDILSLNRNGLSASGPAVADVSARATVPAPGAFAGIVIRLDGDAPKDRTPKDDPTQNPLSSGNPDYDFYSLEVVQRIGYDSFSPDGGVLIAKNKDRELTNGGKNGFACFNWVIDAHPEDINKVDFKRPDGTVVMRTIADYRQLNDALFHAGLNSGSSYEWEDTPNRLHFYVIDIRKDAKGFLTYTLGVRSLDGSGPQKRGVELSSPPSQILRKPFTPYAFVLRNTGAAAKTDPALHPQDASNSLNSDIFRLSVEIEGEGWTAQLQNGLAAVKFGESTSVPVLVNRAPGSSKSAKVTLRAVSESDPTKTAAATLIIN